MESKICCVKWEISCYTLWGFLNFTCHCLLSPQIIFVIFKSFPSVSVGELFSIKTVSLVYHERFLHCHIFGIFFRSGLSVSLSEVVGNCWTHAFGEGHPKCDVTAQGRHCTGREPLSHPPARVCGDLIHSMWFDSLQPSPQFSLPKSLPLPCPPNQNCLLFL